MDEYTQVEEAMLTAWLDIQLPEEQIIFLLTMEETVKELSNNRFL